MPRHSSRAAAADLARVPLDARESRRTRLRRGGPRTPLRLLPVIAALAGVGVAYVNQSAHSTQAIYQASALAGRQQVLRSQAMELSDDLARMQSGARIAAAAQSLGMRPAVRWSYFDAQLHPVVAVPAPLAAAAQPGGDPLQQFVAVLGGAMGLHASGPRR